MHFSELSTGSLSMERTTHVGEEIFQVRESRVHYTRRVWSWHGEPRNVGTKLQGGADMGHHMINGTPPISLPAFLSSFLSSFSVSPAFSNLPSLVFPVETSWVWLRLFYIPIKSFFTMTNGRVLDELKFSFLLKKKYSKCPNDTGTNSSESNLFKFKKKI